MSCAGVLEEYVSALHFTVSEWFFHDSSIDLGQVLTRESSKHVLGSQVFDYWFDSSKFIVVGEDCSSSVVRVETMTFPRPVSMVR